MRDTPVEPYLVVIFCGTLKGPWILTLTEPVACGKPLPGGGVNLYVSARAVAVAQTTIAAATMAAKVNRFIKPLLHEKRETTFAKPGPQVG